MSEDAVKTAENPQTGHIVLTDVTYSYPVDFLGEDGNTSAPPGITDINLRVRPGQVVLLCGASGSGKSTILRTMNGLVPHFHEGEITGTVSVSGTSVPDTELNQMGWLSATVFQNPRTQFFTTEVVTEMAFARENYGDDPLRIREAVLRVAKTTDITQFFTRSLRSLSGGELQRVACACALCADVPVLLFDEPTSNLSLSAIADFREQIRALKQAGKTIVIAEHRLHFLRDLVDDVYRVSQGKIIEHFTGEEFFALSQHELEKRGLRTSEIPAVDLLPPPPKAAGLHLENLRFGYRNHPIFNIDKLTFPAGKITVLAGPNGVGKTTLARLICGLIEEEKGGKVTLDCRPSLENAEDEKQARISRQIRPGRHLKPEKRQQISYLVMQDVRRQLFSESVESEVTLALSKKRTAQTDTSALLADLQLEGLEERHPMSLSGGQQQRLVIASAMACDKQVFIFDEPTSGVDYAHLQSISQQLKKLANQGAVVVVITHDPELSAACADYRVNLLDYSANTELLQRYAPEKITAESVHPLNEPAPPTSASPAGSESEEAEVVKQTKPFKLSIHP